MATTTGSLSSRTLSLGAQLVSVVVVGGGGGTTSGVRSLARPNSLPTADTLPPARAYFQFISSANQIRSSSSSSSSF